MPQSSSGIWNVGTDWKRNQTIWEATSSCVWMWIFGINRRWHGWWIYRSMLFLFTSWDCHLSGESHLLHKKIGNEKEANDLFCSALFCSDLLCSALLMEVINAAWIYRWRWTLLVLNSTISVFDHNYKVPQGWYRLFEVLFDATQPLQFQFSQPLQFQF